LVFFCPKGASLRADQHQGIIADAQQWMYTVRPLVQWHGFTDRHRDGAEFADLVLQLLPRFCELHPGLLGRIQIVARRLALPARIEHYLLTGGTGGELSHEVSFAFWIAPEFGPNKVRLVVFALAPIRGMCSDKVAVLLSSCVVAVA
jgi:hypothetical protein